MKLPRVTLCYAVPYRLALFVSLLLSACGARHMDIPPACDAVADSLYQNLDPDKLHALPAYVFEKCGMQLPTDTVYVFWDSRYSMLELKLDTYYGFNSQGYVYTKHFTCCEYGYPYTWRAGYSVEQIAPNWIVYTVGWD